MQIRCFVLQGHAACMQQVYDWVEYFSGEGKVSAEMRKAGVSLHMIVSVNWNVAWRLILHEANYCGVELDKLIEGAPKAFDFLTEGGFASCPHSSCPHHASCVLSHAEVVPPDC
eukprot:s527_g10.t1